MCEAGLVHYCRTDDRGRKKEAASSYHGVVADRGKIWIDRGLDKGLDRGLDRGPR